MGKQNSTLTSPHYTAALYEGTTSIYSIAMGEGLPTYDFIASSKFAPKPFETNLHHMRFPIPKYHDADKLLDDYNHTNNTSKRSLILAGMSNSMRNDSETILKLIKEIPECYWHIGAKLDGMTFCIKAIETNPAVYDLLSQDMQAQRRIIDAYARGLASNGVAYVHHTDQEWDFGRKNPEPTEAVPYLKYAINEHCNKSALFSPETYRQIHEALLCSEIAMMTCGAPTDFLAFPQYSGAVAFLNEAVREANNDVTRNTYAFIEAENIYKHIDELAQVVREDPESARAISIAIAVAYAGREYETIHPLHLSTEERHRRANEMRDKIVRAEKEFYVEFGEKARAALEDYKTADPALIEYKGQGVDTYMEVAAQHPEMGFSAEEISDWWRHRGEYYHAMKETWEGRENPSLVDRLGYLKDKMEQHPEMAYGQQMTMDDVLNAQHNDVVNEHQH